MNQYKKFNKPVDAIPPTNMLEDFKEPSKLKLINYQELNPSPNKTIITEQIFESHHQTKTAMKKELKGLSKSQKQEVMNELTNKKKILKLPKEEPKEEAPTEETKSPEDPNTIASKNAISIAKKLEKMAKVQEKQEHREKERKKHKNLKDEVYNKYFG